MKIHEWVLSVLLLWGVASVKAAPISLSGGVYPNDAGPDKVDVSQYPKEQQDNYKVFRMKCSKCHTLARPLNAQFLELKQEEMDQIKKERPSLPQDPALLNAGDDVWKRYITRMMKKPGADISKAQAKKIWDFLVYDSKIRKGGPNLEGWLAHRKKLLEDFKQKDPKRYAELFGGEPPEKNEAKK